MTTKVSYALLGQDAIDAFGVTQGTPITTSGLASYEFTGLPATAKNIKLLFRNVSASGLSTGSVQVHLGTSGGYLTTGYTGNIHTIDAGTVSSSTTSLAFLLNVTNSDAYQYTGVMEFTEIGSNVWVQRSFIYANGSRSHMSVGQIDLAGELTSIKVFMGVGTFDGGTINVLYE